MPKNRYYLFKMLLLILLTVSVNINLSPITVLADILLLNTPYSMRLHSATQVMRHNFSIDRPGAVEIHFLTSDDSENDETQWNLRLIDNHRQTVGETNISSSALLQHHMRVRLPAGVYEIRITSGESFSNEEFVLILNFEDESDILAEREPNDSADTATIMEPNRVLIGNTQHPDDVDVFLLRLNDRGLLSVQIVADRISAGLHWAVALQRGSDDIVDVELDPRLNQSPEMLMEAGVYFIYITASPAGWIDDDYRLTTRFTALEKPDQIELTAGELVESSFSAINSSSEFFLSLSSEFEGEHNLALRWHISNEQSGICHIVLLDDSGITIWQAIHDVSRGSYAALLPSLSEGDYRLELTVANEDMDELIYHLGLFYAEQLPTRVELQINNPQMLVNGVAQEIDPGYGTVPQILSGRSVLPIRSIVETLGGSVSWDDEAQRVTIACNGHLLELIIGEETAVLNGMQIEAEVTPIVISGRTMLPLRFISEALGCFVSWISEGELIIVYN